MVTAKGPLEGRDSSTSHAFNKVQGGSSPAPASQPAVSAVRVYGDAIAVKVKRHLPQVPLEGRHSGTSHAQGKATTLPVDCAAAQRRPPQQ